jgi:hypothetical protein
MRAFLSIRVLVPFLTTLGIGLALPTTGQNPSAAPATASVTPAAAGLTDVKSTFDSLKVLPDSLEQGQPLKIIIMPLHIDYAKRRDTQPYYRDSDFQLSTRDTELLQKALADTFTESWFSQRQWQLVTDPAAADLKLSVDFKQFWLAAPLQENITVSRTYAQDSARFTLSGRLQRISDQQPVLEFSDKRKVKPLGAPPGKMDRFNAVTFWRDMRREMDIIAHQLNRAIPSGKNGQKS